MKKDPLIEKKIIENALKKINSKSSVRYHSAVLVVALLLIISLIIYGYFNK